MTQEERLVQENLGLVISVAKYLRPHPNDLEDYIQIGSIGLLKAIRNFNSNVQTSLSTFAWICIYREILSYAKKHKLTTCDGTIEPTYTQCNYLWEIIPQTLTTQENRVLELRIMGYTFKEIGKEFGFSSAWANNSYHKVIQKVIKANEPKKKNINL